MIALLLAPAAARATLYSVPNTNDAGAGSLRQAITNANGHAGPDTISISATGTVTLASALPAVSDDVAITGPGQSHFAVSGADTYEVLQVNAGKTVSISGITITHGLCGGACGNEGGGILNSGTLTLRSSAVTSNIARAVGGNANAFAEGGGIENRSGATLHLVLSRVSQNTASASTATSQNGASGGGVMNRGTLTIDRSTMSSNQAKVATPSGGGFTNATGGAIENDGTLTITRSTLNNNFASATGSTTGNSAAGGGIGNFNAPAVDVTIDRSTVSGNTATATSPGGSQGGGLAASGGTLKVTSSTIAHNTAASAPNLVAFSNIAMKNTIVSNPGGPSNCQGPPGGVTSLGFNLSDDTSCGFTAPTDQTNTDPMLAPSLASNGGRTQTYALQSGSPAIDQGKSSVGETVDQRGKKRPSDFGAIPNAPGGNGTDVGAFELQDTIPPDTIIDSGPSGVIHDPTPTFAFHSTEIGSSFQCRLDSGAAFAPCASPLTVPRLADGTHTFRVRAKDAAGNLDPTPASRSFTVKTAAVNRSGHTLVITAAPGAKDNLQVTRPSPTTIRVTDSPVGAYTGSGIHVVSGSGCSTSGDNRANCNASGITKIQVAAGDQTDRVVNATTLPSSLNGGAANDVVTGGSSADTITGGFGADTMKGRNGNDSLLARDLTSDTLINCDGGTQPGSGDQADLDLLPKDPDAIVIGCETKTRH